MMIEEATKADAFTDELMSPEVLEAGRAALDEVIAEIRVEAAKRLPFDKHDDKFEKLWGKWGPKFFGRGTPLAKNPAVDAVCYKYGIYGYAEKISKAFPDPSPLLWFECFPVADKAAYEKKVRKRSKKSAKFARKHAKLVKRYADIAPLYETDRETPDYERAYQVEKAVNADGFDPRETWNLDHALPMLIYARVASFQAADLAFPMEFETRQEFEEKVLFPILDSFEFQILIGYGEVFEPALDSRVQKLGREEALAVNREVKERITKG